MMTVRQMIEKLQQLQDLDKEVLVNIEDEGFISIESIDACDEEHPGYLIWLDGDNSSRPIDEERTDDF